MKKYDVHGTIPVVVHITVESERHRYSNRDCQSAAKNKVCDRT